MDFLETRLDMRLAAQTQLQRHLVGPLPPIQRQLLKQRVPLISQVGPPGPELQQVIWLQGSLLLLAAVASTVMPAAALC